MENLKSSHDPRTDLGVNPITARGQDGDNLPGD